MPRIPGGHSLLQRPAYRRTTNGNESGAALKQATTATPMLAPPSSRLTKFVVPIARSMCAQAIATSPTNAVIHTEGRIRRVAAARLISSALQAKITMSSVRRTNMAV